MVKGVTRKIFFVPEICKIPKEPGVYYLYNDDKLLYIGLSLNVRQRIRNHQLEYKKSQSFNNFAYQMIDLVFNTITRIEVEFMDRFAIYSREAFAIFWYKPLLNGKTESKPVMQDVKDYFGDLQGSV